MTPTMAMRRAADAGSRPPTDQVVETVPVTGVHYAGCGHG